MRRFTVQWVGCAAVMALFGACGGNDNNNTGTSGTPAGGGTSASDGGTGTTSAPLTEPQVALVLLDANASEVGDGGLGLARATNDQVVAFAQKMVTDHTMALQHARSTIASAAIVPQQSALGQQRSINAVGTDQQLRLQPLSAFDAAFMCQEVQEHARIIQTIDTQTQSAMQGPLAAELQMNRATAVAHLDLASQILTQLMTAQGAGGVTQFCAQFQGTASSAGQ